MRKRRFIDLSVSIEPDLPSDPEMMIPKIQYMNHDEGGEMMTAFFPGLKKEQLPAGKGWTVEFLQLTTHSGTHLDAPWHYHPTMDNGKRALTIDEIPLEWCMGDGVVLDLRHLPDGHRVLPSDVEAALQKIDYQLKAGDIVLVMTGADKHWGTAEYTSKGCGMSREATLWILDHGIRVVGTDACTPSNRSKVIRDTLFPMARGFVYKPKRRFVGYSYPIRKGASFRHSPVAYLLQKKQGLQIRHHQ